MRTQANCRFFRWIHMNVCARTMPPGGKEPVHYFTTGDAGWMQGPSYFTEATAWSTAIDWTLEEPGWATPGFTPGSGWSAAVQQSNVGHF